MATCDPQALARDSSCFFCLPPGYYYPIKLALLARWLKTLSPAADTSVAGLLATASCFACPPQGELTPLKLALLCDIGGGGGASAPAAPLTLTISGASTAGNVVLNWTQGSAPDNNEVWVSTDLGVTYNLLATVAGATTTYSDVTGMGAGTFWVYKVRAKTSGLFSSFSPLAAIHNGMSFANDANLGGYQFFPVLYVILASFDISTSITPTVLNFAVLLKVGVTFQAVNCSNLTSISAPVLASVGGSFNLSGSTQATSSFPSLVTVGANLDLSNSANLTTVAFAALTTIGGNFDVSSSSATSASFPLLKTIGGTMSGSGSSFTSLSFPALTGVAGNIDFDTSVGLTSFSVPNLVITDNLTEDISSCALTAASVNAFLARCVASGLVNSTITLNGGTNAAPTGQGIVDKAALNTAGNTCTTN